MKFELMLTGRIPSSNKKLNLDLAKRIRRQVDDQMKTLWEANPLSGFQKWRANKEYNENTWEGAAVFDKKDRKFVALINDRLLLAARISFHFYDPEGGLDIKSHIVDVDNRLKVLLDLLRVPDDLKQVPEDIDTNYCLLSDDKLVWGVSVERHRLLAPINSENHFTRLVVEVVPAKMAMGNISLFGVEAH
ncbi:hypothetical protein [Roseibium sp.]|uniref:hypothetical protein n=1 Tax=Roseibium sp. TaxID=1936156 RepID=UPI003BABADBC